MRKKQLNNVIWHLKLNYSSHCPIHHVWFVKMSYKMAFLIHSSWLKKQENILGSLIWRNIMKVAVYWKFILEMYFLHLLLFLEVMQVYHCLNQTEEFQNVIPSQPFNWFMMEGKFLSSSKWLFFHLVPALEAFEIIFFCGSLFPDLSTFNLFCYA